MDEKKKGGSAIEHFFEDISKTSTSKQIIIGATSGWCTGFLGMKVGKITAVCVGGGIIILQIAHHNGYITINWNKVNNKIEKITDKVEESVTGQGTYWMDKVERYVDKKIDKAEDLLKKQQKKTKSWYDSFKGKSSQMKDFNIFMISFMAGVALGIATG